MFFLIGENNPLIFMAPKFQRDILAPTHGHWGIAKS